jgi:RNA polymerase-binding protein DksA
MTAQDNAKLAILREQLESRQSELHARLGRVEAELQSSHSKGFADQATEREQDEVLEGKEAVFDYELAQIEAAITRIDNGSYGQCSKCGQAIAPARLAAQPEAPLCISCASSS